MHKLDEYSAQDALVTVRPPQLWGGYILDYRSDSVVRLDSALLEAVSRAGSNVSEILFPRTLLNRMPPIYIADRSGNFTLLSP